MNARYWSLLSLLVLNLTAGAATVGGLRCEYQVDPIVIDIVNPRLSWTMQSDRRGEYQSGYQVLVASRPELLQRDQGDLWDSGAVASSQSIQIEYGGKPLTSRLQCFWKVRLWDGAGHPSAWSRVGRWAMGLLKPDDWTAQWITWQPVPAVGAAADPHGSVSPWFRQTFDLSAKPAAARAYFNVAGYGELYVNGVKVGDDVLAPAVSDYGSRTLYLVYDLTPYLQAGRNCIAVWLGRGWFDPEATYKDPTRGPGPRVRLQCEMNVGGTVITQGTNATWKAAASPYTTIGLYKWCDYSGERYDANLANPNWNLPSLDDRTWDHARVAPTLPAETQSCPRNRIGRRLAPVAITPMADGRYELDFGTDLAGGFVYHFPPLAQGKQITFHFADAKKNGISDEGNPPEGAPETVPGSFKAGVLSGPTGQPVAYQFMNQYDVYLSSGKLGETFATKFNYHGFRYVVVEGLPRAPAKDAAEATLIESDLAPAGHFVCSDPLFNSIFALNLWTLRCLDLGGYLVDCPHRERLGYGDHQVSIESYILNLDMAAFYEKWLRDWRDSQNPETGYVSNTAPRSEGGGGPPWGGALQAVAWRQYLYYGDRRALEENYEASRRHLESLEKRSRLEAHSPDELIRYFGGQWGFIGDWVAPHRGMDTNNWAPPAAAELFTNCYRLILLEQLAKMARVLGRAAEADRTQAQVMRLRPLVHAAFYRPAEETYVLDEQCYQVLPLMAGVVPTALRPAVLAKLERGIRIKNQGHLDTGMYGTYFLLNFLMDSDRNDLVATIMSQKTYPGWGWMLAQGATTSWEQWNGYWSHIHSCYTSAGGWFYEGLAGIRPDERAPGFKRTIIKPAIVGEVTWVKADHDSLYGLIESEWKREGKELALRVTIPPNTSAEVYVPATVGGIVTESGRPAAGAEGVRYVRRENEADVFQVGSGHYQFQSTWAH